MEVPFPTDSYIVSPRMRSELLVLNLVPLVTVLISLNCSNKVLQVRYLNRNVLRTIKMYYLTFL